MERANFIPTRKRLSEALVGGARISHGPFGEERDDGVYARVGPSDLLYTSRHRLFGRHFPSADEAGPLRRLQKADLLPAHLSSPAFGLRTMAGHVPL
jgi:hypothetical protein